MKSHDRRRQIASREKAMSLTGVKAIRFRAILSWRGVLAIGLLALTSPMASSETGASERGWFTPLCAAHDLKSLAAIEKAGERGDIPANFLGEAGLTFLRGRLLCLAGREAEGVATYEGIVSAITSERQIAK